MRQWKQRKTELITGRQTAGTILNIKIRVLKHRDKGQKNSCISVDVLPKQNSYTFHIVMMRFVSFLLYCEHLICNKILLRFEINCSEFQCHHLVGLKTQSFVNTFQSASFFKRYGFRLHVNDKT